ncbi:MAG TPA: superinfection immunity protein [Xanthobacteraceae bacterium]|jgi:hypothetical protein|nr:superinfection immunity protein [Xanthobacteraceae bacterium]
MTLTPEDITVLIVIVAVLIPTIFVYMLPSFIASLRDHPHRRAIFWINLLLGWAGAPWLVVAIWAVVG